jgi:hypothetical protein
MRPTVISSIVPLVMGALLIGCRPSRTVKIAWDPPATAPDGYRILIDEQLVLDIKPPSIDPTCKCMSLAVSVPRGRHTVSVVAYKDSTLGERTSVVVE